MENPAPDSCSEPTAVDGGCAMTRPQDTEEPMIRKFVIVAASVFALASPVFAQQGGTAEQARAMLLKAVTAVKADKAKAIDELNSGTGGFRDRDLYVFCFQATDGKIVALGNPNAKAADRRQRPGSQRPHW